MTDITHSCKWRGSSGNRPPRLEIKDKEAKVRKYNMEILSRSFGHISLSRDQRKREELRLIRTSGNGWAIDKALLQRSMESIHTLGED
jgi:hypothetical protein